MLKNTSLVSIPSAAPQYIQLVDDVTHVDPQKRPTSMEALDRIEKLLYEEDSKNLNTITAR